MNPVKRNPAGVASTKPIALRLMPDERKDAERIAGELNISLSNLARQAYLNGLPLIPHESGINSTAAA